MRPLRFLGAALAVGAATWMLGLAWFIHAANTHADPPARADGIVALTGGAERVETALHLLEEGRADKLLLTGIGGKADFSDIARLAGVDPAPLVGRVTLGRSAQTTHGNAEETAAWVRANNIRTLIVVTAGYHMPRALAELGRALPDVALYPVAVTPPAMRGPAGMRDAEAFRLMAEEYTKWLATRLGLSGEPAG
jgi:uncharacterized SAM-binding protein YcdF (DUF218 family)